MSTQRVDWVSVVAHEMRNPLAAVRAGLALLKKHGTQEGFAAEIIERLECEVHQLCRLSRDLTDEQQVAARHFSLERNRVDLSVVLQRAVETTQPLIQDLGHQLSVCPCPVAALVDGDADRLTQIFVNLLENAACYTHRGGHITISTECNPAAVTVRIQDDGAGIPADLLPHIFDIHTRGAQQEFERPGGTGIGLAIVRDIIRAHGGTIAATSDGEGRGSTFAVKLPTLTGEVAGGGASTPSDSP